MKKYEKRMTIDEERKYLHKMRIRYWQAKRKSERSQLLDEMQEVTGKHRKSLIRLINGDLARKKRSRERGNLKQKSRAIFCLAPLLLSIYLKNNFIGSLRRPWRLEQF